MDRRTALSTFCEENPPNFVPVREVLKLVAMKLAHRFVDGELWIKCGDWLRKGKIIIYRYDYRRSTYTLLRISMFQENAAINRNYNGYSIFSPSKCPIYSKSRK